GARAASASLARERNWGQPPRWSIVPLPEQAADVPDGEAAGLEEPGLARLLPEIGRDPGAETLAPHLGESRRPVRLRFLQAGVDEVARDAALPELLPDPQRAVAAPGPVEDIALGETRVALQAFAGEIGEHARDPGLGVAPRGQLRGKLPCAVLAA